jgi:hypothetical protein
MFEGWVSSRCLCTANWVRALECVEPLRERKFFFFWGGSPLWVCRTSRQFLGSRSENTLAPVQAVHQGARLGVPPSPSAHAVPPGG